MSALEVERMVRSLPEAELRRFAEWWDSHRTSLLGPTGESESEAMKAELRRRRQDYRDHPDQFEHMNDSALNKMFRDIENEKP